jgi:hypothetical protein
MSDLDGLLNRIDAEFSAADKSLKEFQAREVEAYHGRQERLEKFQRTCEQLKEIWQPRLEALAKKLGEKVNVKPTATPSHREATFRFNSTLADIVLRFSVSTDFEVRNLVLDYDLHILPILMKFEPHSRVEFPLDAVNPAAVASWIDDRLVDFVKTYLAVHQNQFYLKDHMVVDPISSTRFPQFAAAGSVNWEGQKFYFVSGETRAEFMTKHGIKS